MFQARTRCSPGVRKLAPGGYLRFGGDGLELGAYWELSFEPDESKTLDEWADEISEVMDAAMRDIVDADEEPVSFLSGGVDSSYAGEKPCEHRLLRIVCGSACQRGGGRPSDGGVSRARFRGHRGDARGFLRQPGRVHRGLRAAAGGCRGAVAVLRREKAREAGERVLSGEGADEFFADTTGIRTPRASTRRRTRCTSAPRSRCARSTRNIT